MAPTPVGHVLTNTINGTEWAPAGGLPTGALDTQVLTWDEDAVSPTEGAWVAGNATSNEQDIALDTANDEIDRKLSEILRKYNSDNTQEDHGRLINENEEKTRLIIKSSGKLRFVSQWL